MLRQPAIQSLSTRISIGASATKNKHKSPQEITFEAQSKLSELDGKDGSVADRGAAQVIVGEYSCVLAEDSWAKARHNVPKEQLVRDFGAAQCQTYQRRAGGSFFWTYRMDWMPGGEWGFRKMNDQHALSPPTSLTLPAGTIRSLIARAESERDQRKSKTVSAHQTYWDTNYPGHYEHWRFEQGWDVGFGDALGFFGMRAQSGFDGGNKIGHA